MMRDCHHVRPRLRHQLSFAGCGMAHLPFSLGHVADIFILQEAPVREGLGA